MQQDLLGELSLPAANSTAESASATPTATSTVSTRQEDLGQTDPASGHKSQPAESQDPGIAPEASQETEATQEPLGEPSPLATHTTASAPATPLATGSNSTEPEGPSLTDPAAGQKPPLAETQDRTPAPKTSASNATRSQRRRSTELDREVRAVKLSEIDGIDDEIREFLAQNRTVERVMQAVHAVTQEPRLVLHHLRHSCGTWLWLKLRSPDYPELSGMLTSMPALCQELRMARRLRIQLCGAVHGPSRTYSHVVARILGHSTPGTSLEHYIHVADLFLAATVMRCATTTPAPVWQRLTDRSRSTVYEWLQRGPHGVIVGHQSRLEHPHSRPESVQPPPSPEVSPWRKKSKAPPVRFRGTGLLGTISKVLHLYNRIDHGGPNADGVGSVAKTLSLSNAQTQVWLDGARLYAPAFGMNADASSGALLINSVPAPYVDLHRASVEALETLSQRLEQAADEHPGLLREALQIATTRFNLRRLDVCFRGEKDEREARRFLKLLDLSGLVPDHVVLTVRRVDPLDTKLPHWFRTPRARAIKTKRLPPPGTSASQAKAYARWVGIQLCSSDGAVQGAAWRIGLFLASIAFLSPAVPLIED